jgi:hypothetical protein
MKDRGMTDEERDLAEVLAQTFDTAAEAQVAVYFESGYRGGIVVRLAWEGRQDSLHFPWRDVARLLTSHLSHDEQNTIRKYREIE